MKLPIFSKYKASDGDAKRHSSVDLQTKILLVTIVAIATFTSLYSPNFLRFTNIVNLFQQIAFPGILALGMTLILLSGSIDLSVGTMLSFCACVSAKMFLLEKGAFIAVTMGLLTGLVCGSINGLIVSKTKAPPFIVTLGLQGVYFGCALLTSGALNLSLRNQFELLGKGRIIFNRIPVSIIIFILIAVTLAAVLHYSKFGRRLYSVGDNPEAAYLAGINVSLYRFLVHAINGLFVALVALILISRLGMANSNVGTGYDLQAIAAAVVGGVSLSGGKGKISGAFIGVALIGLISNSLNILQVPPFIHYVVTGVVIVSAVILSHVGNKD